MEDVQLGLVRQGASSEKKYDVLSTTVFSVHGFHMITSTSVFPNFDMMVAESVGSLDALSMETEMMNY